MGVLRMIKFPDGELLDLLPSSLKNDTDMICLSYALKKAVGRLLAYERSAMTQNFVDSLPEKILDVLAVELRSPYYLDNMEIGVKREIIKNTLIWHTKAGTASAVSEMIGIVFGEGAVVEWPDFDEPPYTPGTFDIVTNAQMTEDITDFFMTVIERVKNERSHVRRVLIKREMEMHEYVAVGGTSSPKRAITNHEQGRENGIHMDAVSASGIISSPEAAITNNGGDKNRDAVMKEKTANIVASSPRESITNNVGAKHSPVSGESEFAGAFAASAPKETIGNTMASESALQESVRAALVAFSMPKVEILSGTQETATLGGLRRNVAAVAMSSPNIKI